MLASLSIATYCGSRRASPPLRFGLSRRLLRICPAKPIYTRTHPSAILSPEARAELDTELTEEAGEPADGDASLSGMGVMTATDVIHQVQTLPPSWVWARGAGTRAQGLRLWDSAACGAEEGGVEEQG